ncbi:MAG: hypothetical protein Q8R91_06325, partial [Candidatus Omnitrophota bacterium]|nr:hypothetical protein [Candidatus Omnitrophota bacterium]
MLLAVYFTSLVMLTFSGISLQRTFIETRASQVSRDNQQAFFLAEGALDFAVKQLETSDLPDDCYKPGDPNTPEDPDKCTKISALPSGTSFTLTTTSAGIVDRNTQEITRTITATGTALGSSATVTATVAAQGPIKGGWAKGPLWVKGMGSDTGLLLGNLRSARGTAAALKLWDNVHHEGGLQIGKSADTTETSSVNNYKGAWQTPMGGDWNDKPGVYLQQFGNHPAPETTADQPAIIPISPLPTVDPPAVPQCAGNVGNITTAANQ